MQERDHLMANQPETPRKVGIASYEEMKARTMEVARGERRIGPDEPKIWFTSPESLANALSAGDDPDTVKLTPAEADAIAASKAAAARGEFATDEQVRMIRRRFGL